VVEIFDVPGDVAAQGENAVSGDGVEAFGGGFFDIIALMLDAQVDEVVFQS